MYIRHIFDEEHKTLFKVKRHDMTLNFFIAICEDGTEIILNDCDYVKADQKYLRKMKLERILK